MELNYENSKVIRSILNKESDINIIKIFGKKKAQEFKKFMNEKSGTFKITTEKLIDFANTFNIPFAYLFLDEIPKTEETLPDFRKNGADFSQNLKSCIATSKKKQEWFRNYLIRNGHNKFLENQNFTSNQDIIQAIKKITHYDEVEKMQKKQRFNQLKTNIEKQNIIVQQSGISQNQTRKIITFNECRGYAIYDEYAPLIFINSNDMSENGKIFTLLHELAHILFRHSGVSSCDFELEEEYRCNDIAGDIIMPTKTFKLEWNKQDTIQRNTERLKDIFTMASPLAISTKALLIKLISYAEYEEFKNAEIKKFLSKKSQSKGGVYYYNVIAANSKNFARSVVIDTLNGYETYKGALNLLDIKKLSSFDKLAKGLGIK